MSSLKDKRIRGSLDGFPPYWYVGKDVQDAVAELRAYLKLDTHFYTHEIEEQINRIFGVD